MQASPLAITAVSTSSALALVEMVTRGPTTPLTDAAVDASLSLCGPAIIGSGAHLIMGGSGAARAIKIGIKSLLQVKQ